MSPGDANEKRSGWVAEVVAQGRARARSAKGAAKAVAAKGAAAAAPFAAGVLLAPVSLAREAASRLAYLAAADALIARSRLLYCLAAGAARADADASSEMYRAELGESARAAREAFEFSERVEAGVERSTRPSAAASASARLAAEAKAARIADAKEALATSGDKDKRKRLVVELAELGAARKADEAEARTSAFSPVYSLVDDFGLEEAAARIRKAAAAASDPAAAAQAALSGRVGAPAKNVQTGGKARELFPQFLENVGDQLQWPPLSIFS